MYALWAGVQRSGYRDGGVNKMGLDVNLRQDNIRRKSPGAARNLDTIQRIAYSVFSIWKGLRKRGPTKEKASLNS